MEVIKKALPKYKNHSLMISELYVPLTELDSFMNEARYIADQTEMNIVYGTVRLIKEDNESFLAWANKDYACIIFNLMVEHSELGILRAKKQFRSLIDLALERDGSFFLTYHRWATKKQLLKAYPQFIDFLKYKKKYDPQERFQSDWYRYYKVMFNKAISDY